MNQTFELEITSDPRLLRVVRATVDQVCQIAGFSKLEASKIVLAVDEACSNIIRHAYKEKDGEPIIITCHVMPTKIEITIVDYGEQVDSRKIKSRPLSELRPGGLGVHLIKTVMDKVQYSNIDKIGNRLVMEKAIPEGDSN